MTNSKHIPPCKERYIKYAEYDFFHLSAGLQGQKGVDALVEVFRWKGKRSQTDQAASQLVGNLQGINFHPEQVLSFNWGWVLHIFELFELRQNWGNLASRSSQSTILASAIKPERLLHSPKIATPTKDCYTHQRLLHSPKIAIFTKDGIFIMIITTTPSYHDIFNL